MSLTMADKTGEEWWFAEVVSFFCRCFDVLAISCLAVGGDKGTVTYGLFIALAFGFLINCLEFSRPARENLVIHLLSLSLATMTALLIFLLATQSLPTEHYKEKYLSAIFCGVTAMGSGLMSAEFYIYSS